MSTLEDRLAVALEHGKVTKPQLARYAGVTAAAISKLFNGKSKELKAAHAFKFARLCKVDAEWLATGHGTAPGVRQKPGEYRVEPEFEPKHVDLLRMYKRLPPEVRGPIRDMIQTLAAAQREDYATWTRHQRALAREKSEA